MRKLTMVLAFLVGASCGAAAPLQAAVTPHGLFTEGCVLQQGAKVPVWGTADADEKVTVSIQGQEVSTTARDGKWLVHLENLKAGGPFELTIAGSNQVQLKNVLVGEVWVCSGQSNMEMALTNARNGKEAIADAANANIRLFTVQRGPAKTPQQDLPGTTTKSSWAECNPRTVQHFSAVGYFFGRDLQKARNVPIGLIHSSWGGTAAERWTSAATLEGNAELKGLKGSDLYNGMIAPLQPYAIKGVIWYQGESNAGRADQYLKLFSAMIRNWRADWKQGEFPFLFVQLAPWGPGKQWPELREAQLLTSLTVPHTAMVVTTDVGDPKDIHPKDKDPIGARLALAARALAYGEQIPWSGPFYSGMKVDGDKAVLSFKHVGGGLVAKGGALTGFTVAGEDRKFVKAEAVIEHDTVVVRSPEVARPVAVRYGWDSYPVVNLFNREGLPASPFRTDMPEVRPVPQSSAQAR